MNHILLRLTVFLVIIVVGINISARAQTPTIVSTVPTQNALNVPAYTDIAVVFDQDMDQTTLNNATIVVNGTLTGLHQGIFSYDALSKTVTLNPDFHFAVGEVVTVVLTKYIKDSGGIQLVTSYSWQFMVAVQQVLEHKSSPIGPSAPYSGGGNIIAAADLDQDGDIDIVASDHDSISVHLNNGDGTMTVVRIDTSLGDSSKPTGETLTLRLIFNDVSWCTVIADGDTVIMRIPLVGKVYEVEALIQMDVSISKPKAIAIATCNNQVIDLADSSTGRISKTRIDRNNWKSFIRKK